MSGSDGGDKGYLLSSEAFTSSKLLLEKMELLLSSLSSLTPPPGEGEMMALLLPDYGRGGESRWGREEGGACGVECRGWGY